MGKYIVSISIFILGYSLCAYSQLTISFETGRAYTQYNDVRAPNENLQQGTFFSLANDFQDVEKPVYFRIEGKYLLNAKHTIEFSAVPLTVQSKGYNGDSLDFENEIFSGSDINGSYQFNTYRLSYRYRIMNRPKFLFDLGVSLLVRDAAITIVQNDVNVSNTDLGFVPLISLYSEYKINPKFQIILKGDALVGPVGRAEDFFLGFQYSPSKKVGIKAGYRIIEGGADVDQVYNFAFFHFASLAAAYTF